MLPTVTERIKWKINQTILFWKLRLFKLRKKYFIYFHLPKTAGTAIKYYSRKRRLTNRLLTLPHKYNFNNVKFKSRNIVQFGTLRNPFSWYVSLYKFKMESKSDVKNYPKMENNSFQDFFDDLVLFKNGIQGIKKWHKPWKKNSAPYNIAHNYRSKYGFYTNNILYYFGENELEIVKMENLNENLKKLFQGEIDLKIEKKINTSNHGDFMEYYTPDMIKKVQKRDKVAFDLWQSNS